MRRAVAAHQASLPFAVLVARPVLLCTLAHLAAPLFACHLCASGEVVMVLDAGGGTVDTTVHSCEARGGHVVLAEVVHAAGALCGSVYVDQAFK